MATNKTIAQLTEITSPADVDEVALHDNDVGQAKRFSWSNIKATLKTYFDTLYRSSSTDIDLTADVTGTLPLGNGGTGQITASAAFNAIKQAATTSATGVSELTTTAEVDTGTDTSRTITPDALAGSYCATKSVQMAIFDFTTEVATGDGKFYFHVPTALDGMNLVAVHAEVITAGTTGTTDIQIYNLTDTVDMLSTKITIDSGETGSDTAATPPVIDTDNDDVATNDVIRIDVDAVSTTAPEGLLVTMEFRLP